MSLGPRHKKKRMNLNIKDINIKSSSGIDLLGVAIDDDLNFTQVSLSIMSVLRGQGK